MPGLPHNLDAERSVLGAVLLDSRHLDGLLELGLREDDFYDSRLGAVYAAMVHLHDEHVGIDYLTVADELRRGGHLDALGGTSKVEELAAWVPATGNARQYGLIVRELAQRRAIIAGSEQVRDEALNGNMPIADLLTFAEKTMGVLDTPSEGDLERLPFEEELARAERVQSGHADPGMPTGYKDLDSLIGGWQDDALVVLAARPSMGKTTLVVNLAEAVLQNGGPVAMFSLEMSRSELLRRMLATRSGVSHEQILRGPLTSQQLAKINQASTDMTAWPFYVDEAVDCGVYEVRSRARRLHSRLPYGLGLIIIDYLQLLRPDDPRANRNTAVAEMTRGLKTLAKELHVPVVCVSQLNRDLEKRADRRPQLSDLRDSGAVEQDADMVLFLYREGYYDKTVDSALTELNVAKNRAGRCGIVNLTFLAQYPRFASVSPLGNDGPSTPF